MRHVFAKRTVRVGGACVAGCETTARAATAAPPHWDTSRNARILAFLLVVWSAPVALRAQDTDAQRLAPWLDVPSSWLRHVENGRVLVTPNDLPPGAQLVIIVEPMSTTSQTLTEAYEQAIRDLGPWRPVAQPLEQQLGNGWAFRHGLGVATLNGSTFTGHTAVAREGQRMVRIWVLAESDATYNRYKNAIVNAIASVQDIPAAVAVAPTDAPVAQTAPSGSTPTVNPDSLTLVAGFGEGVSGVYVGIERGVRAMAGVGPGGGPALASEIEDFEEVHVFFPDRTFRQRMPIRGLATDLAWERKQIPGLWGTWTKEGDRVTVTREGTTSTYTISDQDLVDDRGRSWVKLAIPAHATLDGTYARANAQEPDAPRLTLRADGTYEDRGLLRTVGLSWNLLAPDGDALSSGWTDAQARQMMAGGSGRYVFDAFSLTFRDNDGRIWRINAYVPPGQAMPTAGRLVIDGRSLVRLFESGGSPDHR
jgi:hypothetical protein